MTKETNQTIDKMFKVGAHFGLTKARRHPTAKPFVFGVKNKIEIIDLEKTDVALTKAVDFVKSIAASGRIVLFASSKSEALPAVRLAGAKTGCPFVAGRWIGGTITNYTEIKKRIEKLETRLREREKGELAKYTKKERLLIDREIEKLDRFFAGLVPLKEKPAALIVVDSKREHNAVAEAQQAKIPVIAINSTDCDLSQVNYAIPANDASAASIGFFLGELATAYSASKVARPARPEPRPESRERRQ